MVINIICTILSGLGIYGFYTNNYILLIIGTIAVIAEFLIGFFTNQSKELIPMTAIVGAIIGIIVTHKLWIGICIGICFESVILTLVGWFLMFVFKKPISK